MSGKTLERKQLSWRQGRKDNSWSRKRNFDSNFVKSWAASNWGCFSNSEYVTFGKMHFVVYHSTYKMNYRFFICLIVNLFFLSLAIEIFLIIFDAIHLLCLNFLFFLVWCWTFVPFHYALSSRNVNVSAYLHDHLHVLAQLPVSCLLYLKLCNMTSLMQNEAKSWLGMLIRDFNFGYFIPCLCRDIPF